MKKASIKKFIPPILTEILSKKSKYGWYGDFDTWDKAIEKSVGYDDPNILERVRSTLLKVKNDRTILEKDLVFYSGYDYPYNFQVLASFLYISQLSNNKLSVIDFGGSLGSSYFQHRRMLSYLSELDYNIIEQKQFVDAGKKYFEDEHLSFHYDFRTCISKKKPDCVLLSGVLQYLERPVDLINEILGYNIDYIIIDRTPFYLNKPDRITVQILPPRYGEGSMPYRIFNYEKFTGHFLKKYSVVIESAANDKAMIINNKNWSEEPARAEKRFILFKLADDKIVTSPE